MAAAKLAREDAMDRHTAVIPAVVQNPSKEALVVHTPWRRPWCCQASNRRLRRQSL